MSSLPTVIIHTDGACSGNPGPGGWGAILKFGDVEKEMKGGEAHTTNNRMELMAAISALEALKKPCIGRSLHRQPIRPSGHHGMDSRLEEERLAHRRQEAGQECRAVAAPRRCAQAASGALALGQGPCRPRRKRARRSTGARRRRDGAAEGVIIFASPHDPRQLRRSCAGARAIPVEGFLDSFAPVTGLRIRATLARNDG